MKPIDNPETTAMRRLREQVETFKLSSKYLRCALLAYIDEYALPEEEEELKQAYEHGQNIDGWDKEEWFNGTYLRKTEINN